MNRDLNKVLKEISIVAKKGKVGKNYFVKVDLVNGSSTEMFAEREFVEAIKVLKDIYEQPIKKKILVEEISEDKGVTYICVLIELADGSEFRFFPRRAFNIIINALYSKETNKDKKEK